MKLRTAVLVVLAAGFAGLKTCSLVSIDAPGRALFTCAGRNVTGLEIIHELRAGAASDGRVLTFGRVGRESRAGRS